MKCKYSPVIFIILFIFDINLVFHGLQRHMIEDLRILNKNRCHNDRKTFLEFTDPKETINNQNKQDKFIISLTHP